jgi:hypothetical protein
MGTFQLIAAPDLPKGLEHPDIAESQDGLFTRSQARAEGFSDGRQRRLLRAGIWVPVAGRALRNRAVDVGPWQRARAVSLTGLVASHDTAGQLWSLATDRALHGISRTRRVDSITIHRLALSEPDVISVRGVRVTTPGRTLADLLCWLAPIEAAPFVTDGLRRGVLTIADIDLAAERARGRWGAWMARYLARSCAGNPHSFLEWSAQHVIRGLGPGWEFNVAIHDQAGLVGIVDALHRPTMTVVEFDGRAFHGDDRFQRDRTRDQRLVALGFLVIRFTHEDVERRPREFEDRVRRAVYMRARNVA